ncbi:MAG: hypothetical protein KAS32_28855 [Candidatus Peribacteraceae bacterium]|nr:hypothetical protein [Candidatus Peribacteraceae bacterium]
MKNLIILLLLPLLLSACAIKDDLTDAEKEFNNSGRAKAIEDPTDLWMVYEDEEAGFSLKYPHSVTMDLNLTGATLILSVSSNEIEELEGTMGYNEETALKNKETLGKGEYGESVDFPLEESKKVRNINGTFAQDFLVLGRFEVCDVTFERKLYFFHNNHQIVITLHGDKESMMKDIEDFLTLNEENCFEEMVWKFKEVPNLYSLLESGSGSALTQEWFNTFDEILDTIKFTKNTQAKLQGLWTSEDDPLSQIEFAGNIQKQIYNGETLSEDEYSISNKSPVTENTESGEYLHVNNDDEMFEYKILSLEDDVIELMYLPRGNTLKYKK